MNSPLQRATRIVGCVLLAVACQSAAPTGPEPPAALGYRFSDERRPSRTPEADRLSLRYPELFAVLVAPREEDADLRAVRSDLRRMPSDVRSYDALNAVAVVFFELHRRAERERSGGSGFLRSSFRATQVMAVPWRAYGEVEDRALRSAILDFYEDLLLGDKSGLRSARGRFTTTVESLLRWESDPALIARIEGMLTDTSQLERGRR